MNRRGKVWAWLGLGLWGALLELVDHYHFGLRAAANWTPETAEEAAEVLLEELEHGGEAGV